MTLSIALGIVRREEYSVLKRPCLMVDARQDVETRVGTGAGVLGGERQEVVGHAGCALNRGYHRRNTSSSSLLRSFVRGRQLQSWPVLEIAHARTLHPAAPSCVRSGIPNHTRIRPN